MSRFVPRRLTPRKSHKLGMAPGSVVPVEAPELERVRISVMDYGPEEVEAREVSDVEECLTFRDSPSVSWINVTGLHDAAVVERLGRHFGLHPLVLEDLVNTEHRPKLEDYEGYLFLVVKMLTARDREVVDEQVSLVLGPGWVLSFQEREGDVFDPVRQRIRAGKGRIRSMGADYLAYALVDAVVDHYFVVLEKLGDWVQAEEAEVVKDPDEETVHRIHRLKRELLLMRKAVWPMREVTSTLQREETSLVSSEVTVFARDAYDHTIQVIDTVETLRDLTSGMLDTYLTSVSNRMNEVMKVLTVMASIFIPLTFVAGVYGMNFENMPELSQPWGYPAVLLLMAVVAVGMVIGFRARDWI